MEGLTPSGSFCFLYPIDWKKRTIFGHIFPIKLMLFSIENTGKLVQVFGFLAFIIVWLCEQGGPKA